MSDELFFFIDRVYVGTFTHVVTDAFTVLVGLVLVVIVLIDILIVIQIVLQVVEVQIGA